MNYDAIFLIELSTHFLGVLFDLDTVHLDGQPGQLPAPVPSTFSLLLRVQVVQPGPASNSICSFFFGRGAKNPSSTAFGEAGIFVRFEGNSIFSLETRFFPP